MIRRRDGAGDEASLTERLRHRVMAAVHLGHLRPGDRLPSIRVVARELGATHHAVARAYRRLEGEGVVEKRPRSGTFVAPLPHRRPALVGESGQWVAQVLSGACAHQIRLPAIPDLLRRWTSTVPLRCACVESDRDHLRALAAHVGGQFGLECAEVEVGALAAAEAGGEAGLPAAVAGADLLVTTTFHGPLLRRVADRLDRPLVVMTVDPAMAAMVEARLRDGRVTLICADPRFGERLLALRAGPAAERFHVVVAGDGAAVRALDPAEPVLLTRAAREELGALDLRLLAPSYPAFSLDCSRELCELVVHLNMAAERSADQPSPGPSRMTFWAAT